MRTVNVQEAKTHLSRLLREVEGGEEIAIARAGKIVARLSRGGEHSRRWGIYEGQVTIADDAFDPIDGTDWDDSELEP